jgi:hypothetical protein
MLEPAGEEDVYGGEVPATDEAPATPAEGLMAGPPAGSEPIEG